MDHAGSSSPKNLARSIDREAVALDRETNAKMAKLGHKVQCRIAQQQNLSRSSSNKEGVLLSALSMLSIAVRSLSINTGDLGSPGGLWTAVDGVDSKLRPLSGRQS